MSRRLVVGLGNPGAQYAGNRHNIGFMLIDQLADDAGIQASRSKFKGLYGTGSISGESVALLKPQTFMNLSGQSVSPARSFFDVEFDDILVIHDELDLPYGTVRLKLGGGHAGHNGLKSIIAQLGTRDFARLRMGIGRPEKGAVNRYVLGDFASGEERESLPAFLDEGGRAVKAWLTEGMRKAMNSVNAS
ncbi:MAG: aminoacyl-tRNA hydrolase [Bradymonadia bacterium]